MSNPSIEQLTTLYVAKTFEVREHDAPTKYVWKGDTRVARVTGPLTANSLVQRLRVHPGWNLCSLAVSATNATAQLNIGQGTSETLFKWNSQTASWLSVAPGETLLAGTVFWLMSSAGTTLPINGTYADPIVINLTAGPDFLPCFGLEVWNPGFNQFTNASFFKFDAAQDRWRSSLAPSLAGYSDLPDFIAPGEAFFARDPAPLPLEVPDSTLRIRYYHQDHLGSSSCWSDSGGRLVEEGAFYPYGHLRRDYEIITQREVYQFPQKEIDQETSLHYFSARFLRDTPGSFLSLDQAAISPPRSWLPEPQKLNSYRYALNKPLIFTDPNGTDPGPPDDVHAIILPLPAHRSQMQYDPNKANYGIPGGGACRRNSELMIGTITGRELQKVAVQSLDTAGSPAGNQAKLTEALEYIKGELSAGRGVVVGVHIAGTESTPNGAFGDYATQHFLAVYGYKKDADGNVTLLFRDPGTVHESKSLGTLKLEPTGNIMVGKAPYYNAQYQMTTVRLNTGERFMYALDPSDPAAFPAQAPQNQSSSEEHSQ